MGQWLPRAGERGEGEMGVTANNWGRREKMRRVN